MKTKDIIGFEGYKITFTGTILSKKRALNKKDWYEIKAKMSRHGYWIIQLMKNGKPVTRSIHRLLAEHYIPNPEAKRCVNHKNGIKTDNRLENLEWMTDSENCIHAFKIGKRNNKGEKNPNFKKML